MVSASDRSKTREIELGEENPTFVRYPEVRRIKYDEMFDHGGEFNFAPQSKAHRPVPAITETGGDETPPNGKEEVAGSAALRPNPDA